MEFVLIYVIVPAKKYVWMDQREVLVRLQPLELHNASKLKPESNFSILKLKASSIFPLKWK